MPRMKWSLASIGVASFLAPALALAQAPDTLLVSGNAFTVPGAIGVDAASSSSRGSLSGDGRFVAFSSAGTNLVNGDSNGFSDVFMRNLINPAQFRVSLTQSGGQGNGDSFSPAVSATGRFVAYTSRASNLVPGDTNGTADIFVRDLGFGGTVTRVNLTQTGGQANSISSSPAISADGRFVAFASSGSNLAAGDTNGTTDIFLRDLIAGTTEIVSVSTAGQVANGSSSAPVVSADGRYVAFASVASNLVGDDTNGFQDVFVRDRVARTTERASVGAAGQTNGHSFKVDISGGGRYVAFDSAATNLVSGDGNGVNDVFVRDRIAGTTARVSVNRSGAEGNASSRDPVISADGRHVAFVTDATNLGLGEDIRAGADIYHHDRTSRTTQIVSIDPDRLLFGSGNFGNPSISAEGRFVVFDGIERSSPQISRNVWLRDRAVDPGVRLSVSEASATEGSLFGTGTLLFSVNLSARTTENVTFQYWTEDVTARSGSDYVRAVGTASIPPGQISTTIAVGAAGNLTCENQETMNLNIDVPQGATIGDGQGVGTIRDDDCPSRTVGEFDLSPADAVVAAGERVTYAFSWTVPSESWTDLDSLEFRVGEDGEVLWLRFDETTRTFALVDPWSGRSGPGFAAGRHARLSSGWAHVHLADTQVVTDGPDSPEVTLLLDVSFARRVAGAEFPIEVQATNDDGDESGFEPAGSVTVVRRRH